MTSKGIQRTAPLIWCACLLVSSTLMALIWPIFTDEVAWKWITSRFWLDSGQAISLYPQCLSQKPTNVPFLFIPIRILEALLYGTAQSIFLLRWIGVLNFFCNGFLFWQLTQAIARVRRLNPKETFLGISAIGFFGVLPFLLSMNRPEQVLVFCLLLFAWFPLVEAKSRIQKWGLSFGFCTVSLLFFSQHAKGLFFLPLVLFSSWSLQISKKNRWIVSACAFALASQCFLFFTEHTQCQNQFIQEAFGKMMISPGAILTSPLETFLGMVQNGFHVVDYIRNILISDVYPQQWLPTNYGFSLGTQIVNGLIQLFFVLWISACAWGILTRARIDGAVPTFLNLMGLGIVIGVLGMAVFQSGKSFYDSALVVPLVIILGITFIDKEVMRLLGKGAFILGTASVGLMAYRLWPSVKND
ncbi:MAG: hypothetical protein EBQ92_11400, partial [Proteobacteria bacterium]|nr:hypothetical protein [Pseudomonadota bacterium]